jgi:hypothetical protein
MVPMRGRSPPRGTARHRRRNPARRASRFPGVRRRERRSRCERACRPGMAPPCDVPAARRCAPSARLRRAQADGAPGSRSWWMRRIPAVASMPSPAMQADAECAPSCGDSGAAGQSAEDSETNPNNWRASRLRSARQARLRRRAGDDGACRRAGCDQTTEPSLKMGRYIDTTMPPMMVPRNTMITGSIRLDRPATISSTSDS